MKRYKFRLETVLRVRKVEEGVVLQRVSQANRALFAAEVALETAASRYESIPELLLPEMDSLTFQSIRDEASRVARAVDNGKDAVSRARAGQVAALGELAEARRRVTLLERLDAQRRKEWLERAARNDIVELDDFANTRAANLTWRLES